MPCTVLQNQVLSLQDFPVFDLEGDLFCDSIAAVFLLFYQFAMGHFSN